MPEHDTKSEKKHRKPEYPTPAREPREIFLAALDATGDLLKAGAVSVDVGSAGQIEFDFEDGDVKKVDAGKLTSGLTPSHLCMLLRSELSSLLRATACSDAQKGLEKEIPARVLQDVGAEEFLWRLERFTERGFISPEMMEHAALKRTAKGFVLDKISWETGLKIYDGDEGKLEKIRYVQLCIRYSSPTTTIGSLRLSGEGLSVDIPTVAEPKQLNLELHKADVEKIAKSLKQILEALDKVGSEA